MFPFKINAFNLYKASNYVPYVSTATNLATLIFKAAVWTGVVPNSVLKNKFSNHLYNKSKLSCVILLFPRWGNIAFAISQLFMLAVKKTKLYIGHKLDESNKKMEAQLVNLQNFIQNDRQLNQMFNRGLQVLKSEGIPFPVHPGNQKETLFKRAIRDRVYLNSWRRYSEIFVRRFPEFNQLMNLKLRNLA